MGSQPPITLIQVLTVSSKYGLSTSHHTDTGSYCVLEVWALNLPSHWYRFLLCPRSMGSQPPITLIQVLTVSSKYGLSTSHHTDTGSYCVLEVWALNLPSHWYRFSLCPRSMGSQPPITLIQVLTTSSKYGLSTSHHTDTGSHCVLEVWALNLPSHWYRFLLCPRSMGSQPPITLIQVLTVSSKYGLSTSHHTDTGSHYVLEVWAERVLTSTSHHTDTGSHYVLEVWAERVLTSTSHHTDTGSYCVLEVWAECVLTSTSHHTDTGSYCVLEIWALNLPSHWYRFLLCPRSMGWTCTTWREASRNLWGCSIFSMVSVYHAHLGPVRSALSGSTQRRQ